MDNSSDKIAKIIIALVVLIGLLMAMAEGGGSSSGKKWGDLNDQEKANAKWAYYAQQAINERK